MSDKIKMIFVGGDNDYGWTGYTVGKTYDVEIGPDRYGSIWIKGENDLGGIQDTLPWRWKNLDVPQEAIDPPVENQEVSVGDWDECTKAHLDLSKDKDYKVLDQKTIEILEQKVISMGATLERLSSVNLEQSKLIEELLND